MRRIATVVAATALFGTLLAPTSAVAAESPLPNLTSGVCDAQVQAPATPTPASVLLGPVTRQLPAPAEKSQAMESPAWCSTPTGGLAS